MSELNEKRLSTSQNEPEKPSKHPMSRKNNFPKGVSGNPNGKPKGALQKKTILEGMMKYNMVVSPSLLRRSEAVLERIVAKAETGDMESERMVLQYVLSPFLKMQALKQSGLKDEGRPIVNINISEAKGLAMNQGRILDA